jgi:hypothetical protein
MGRGILLSGEDTVSAMVPFKEGDYLVERAFVFASGGAAVPLEDAQAGVYRASDGRMRMEGSGRIRNFFLVELLDDADRVDLALDFGEDFTYLTRDPILRSGKVFSPGTQSRLQFIPRNPLERVPPEEFEALVASLRFLGA